MAVARLGSQVFIIQEGGGEHQGEQVEEVIVPSDDNQDLKQYLGEGSYSEPSRVPAAGTLPLFLTSWLLSAVHLFSIHYSCLLWLLI